MSSPRSDIVFVFPPAPARAGHFSPHLGAAYLRASLSQQGITTHQYLSSEPASVSEVARELLREKPLIVGFTAYDSNFPLCLALARAIKQQQPEVSVVFGGPTPTFGAREVMARHPSIDLCIRGESEQTAAPVFQQLLDHRFPNENHRGISFRRDGEIVSTPDAPLVADAGPADGTLDVTPSPYLSGMLLDGRAGLLTGRGCTHHCQYCSLGRKSMRFHSLDRILAELEFISTHQRRNADPYPVGIHDDAFTLNPDRARRICQAIIERGLKLRLSCITRADTVDDELLRLMWQAGFVSIAFGLESAVPSVLRAIGKVRPPDWHDADLAPERQFVEDMRRSVVSAHRIGFRVCVSIILGLPTERPADARATLRFVRQLPVDSYIHNFLWLFPGAPLWSTRKQYGLDCAIDSLGLPETIRWPFNLHSIRPTQRSQLETKAKLLRSLAIDVVDDCSSPSTYADSVSTVIVDSPELTTEHVSWLAEILAVGGLVVQRYPAITRHRRSDRVNHDRALMRQSLVPVAHYVQLELQRAGDGTTHYLLSTPGLDVYSKHFPRILCLSSSDSAAPFHAWSKGTGSIDIADLSSGYLVSSELDSLTTRIFADTNFLRNLPIPPKIGYAGRWLCGSRCESLFRLEVDSCGNVRCCRYGEPLGRVGDTLKQLRSRLAELRSDVERRRGCEHCSLANCPRCPFPGMEDRAYCETVSRCAARFATINMIRIYAKLPSIIARQADCVAARG